MKQTRPGKDNGGKEDHHDQGGDKGGKGPNRINNNGDGHVIGVSSSTRRGMKPIDLKIAQVQIGNLPQHVRPCDTYRHGANGELVDACIEADLLAYAPKHTFVSAQFSLAKDLILTSSDALMSCNMRFTSMKIPAKMRR